MILQIFPNNKLFPAACFSFFIFIFFFFFGYFSSCFYLEILKRSLTIVLLYFLNKTKNWFLVVLGSLHSTQLDETDPKSKNRQRRCKVCTRKICYKCCKCSKPEQPLLVWKKDGEIPLQDFTVNISMNCQVVHQSKAAIALNKYIII